MITTDTLAQEIRRVDGSHSMSAGALAEALMPFIWANLRYRDPEVDALKRDAMQTLAAVVCAAGGRVMVRTHHILEAQRGTLLRDIDAETGGYLFRREGDTSDPTIRASDEKAAPVAWAWSCDGMKGWALGHNKPTPDNTHKFHERNTVVRPLVFGDADLVAESAGATQPIPMILHCPSCGEQHVDAVEHEGREDCDTVVWNNPPHRSHLCHNCGTIWRPSDVPTVGVASIKTKGKADRIVPAQEKADSVAWGKFVVGGECDGQLHDFANTEDEVKALIQEHPVNDNAEFRHGPLYTAPMLASNSAWEAIVEECMLTEAVTPIETDPRKTIKDLIDWHLMVDRELSNTQEDAPKRGEGVKDETH